MILSLAFKSLWNRRITALLTLLTISFSVMLLIGVERIRKGARHSFANTISGTDLIVGARSGPVQLLLYSVFRIGNATNNISWESYQELAANRQVKWTIPISLGDSHRGYRVMGTTQDYFKHYKYRKTKKLELAEGQQFSDLYDAVLGAEVAKKLGYQMGEEIILSHGVGDIAFTEHDTQPFQVIGILEKTGTPIDRTIHVSLEAIEAIHVDWQNGAPPIPGEEVLPEEVRAMELTPTTVTAFFVGLRSRISTFRYQRLINDYSEEPLMAILPGATLHQLWEILGAGEIALLAVSGFVVLTGLTGMLTAILTSLNERRREMAIMRSVGARPIHIFTLMVSEAGLLASLGAITGLLSLYGLLIGLQPIIEDQFGLFIPVDPPSLYDLSIVGLVIGAGLLMGSFPAWRAYRNSLSDGMTIRI